MKVGKEIYIPNKFVYENTSKIFNADYKGYNVHVEKIDKINLLKCDKYKIEVIRFMGETANPVVFKSGYPNIKEAIKEAFKSIKLI